MLNMKSVYLGLESVFLDLQTGMYVHRDLDCATKWGVVNKRKGTTTFLLQCSGLSRISDQWLRHVIHSNERERSKLKFRGSVKWANPRKYK